MGSSKELEPMLLAWAHGRPLHGCYAMNQCTPVGARPVHPIRRARRAHYHHCGLGMLCPNLACLGPSSTLNPLSSLMGLNPTLAREFFSGPM